MGVDPDGATGGQRSGRARNGKREPGGNPFTLLRDPPLRRALLTGALVFAAGDLLNFYLPIYAEAAAELARIAPMAGKARAYLGNSGTEVVEAAIKLARYATKRPYVVSFLGAFHGRTYGSVSLTASR